jgi:hypothetical protein
MHWQGELLHIHVAPLASAPMQALAEARLFPGASALMAIVTRRGSAHTRRNTTSIVR